MSEHIIIHTDGGARGNPGPAAIGVVVEGGFGKKEFGEYLGVATNNEAEYKAVILALKKTKQLLGSSEAKNADVEIFMDSELIERQLNGEYKIKEKSFHDYFMEIWNLKSDFKSVLFRHILRAENSEADRIVNQVLDKEGNRLGI